MNKLIMDDEGWKAMIDQHFETDYKMDHDWNINFFLSEGIINNRFYEVLY